LGIGLAGLALWLAPSAFAATIPVNIATDTVLNDANCSLREAVTSAQANAANAADGCVDGESAVADVITLKAPDSNYTLAGTADENSNAGGDLDIKQPPGADAGLTIRGDLDPISGPLDVIDGADIDRVIHVLATTPVEIDTVAVEHGLTGGEGGGIFAAAGSSLTVKGSQVLRNAAIRGGGIYKASGGALNISDSSIGGPPAISSTGNLASQAGGGLYSEVAPNILRTVVEDNTATEAANADGNDFSGGGIVIRAASGNAVIQDSTIKDNDVTSHENGDSAQGAGIELEGPAPLRITGSTISGNNVYSHVTSSLPGSAVRPGGGGVWQSLGTSLEVLNSTISGNSTTGPAVDVGGAIAILNSAMSPASTTLVHTTITLNTTDGALDGIANPPSAALTLRGSIINQAGEGCQTAAVANAYNVDAGQSCVGPNVDSDLPDTLAMLEDLANHGGPTDTHALPPTSPALDVVPPAACLNLTSGPLLVDQRGAQRPFAAGCDAGSYERVICNGIEALACPVNLTPPVATPAVAKRCKKKRKRKRRHAATSAKRKKKTCKKKRRKKSARSRVALRTGSAAY
jgi:CSLREA domain-containing protein